MRKLTIGITAVLFALPLSALATWQVANPFRSDPMRQVVNPALGKTDYPARYESRSKYMLYTHKGTLKSNVTRYAAQHGWKVQWDVHHVYHVLLKTKIAGPTFEIALHRLLLHYPVKAKFNNRKRIVWIQDPMSKRHHLPKYTK